MVSGTSRAAHTAHTPDATVPSRSARYPAASRTPLLCRGTRNAAKRNDPTANTAAISPAARTNGSPSVVAGPGSGRPVAVNASASDHAPIPAAVQPASTATPINGAHTGARGLPTGRATVMHPGYWRAARLRGLATQASLAGLDLAGDELIARNPLDVIEISDNVPQFSPEGDPPFGEVFGGRDQILVDDNLVRGGEQQRRYRFAATDPGLCHVLPADPERQLGQFLLTDIGRRIAQHVGDDPVCLE